MIQLERVKRQFGPQILFEDLSWLIPAGARVGLVGPNGAGKTTLLRILVSRETPDGGSVHRPQSLRIGYLPQEVETVQTGSVLSVALSGSEELAELEARLEQLGREMAALPPDDPAAPKLTEEYGNLRQRFEHLDGDRIEARAKAILSGLGVSPSCFDDSLETLSGGWRMRVVLARLLLGDPGLLLLDEPTNHLDLEAIGWLEEFLRAYEGAFVVVSHDRYFLNRMVRSVAELERGRLTLFTGNYDQYLAQKAVHQEQLEKKAAQQARELAKTERFIERFRYKNTKARQVQSRVRALDKIERVQTERERKRIRFGFAAAPRSGDVVVRAESMTHSYGDLVVYRGLDLLLRRGDRVALVGPNGAGKSTLLKLLAGRISPTGGCLELGHQVIRRYYAQHQLDDLDPRATLLEELERVAPPGELLRLRKLLGAFLFTGDDVAKKVAVLSGGEKARLALAKLLVNPANLLLLDEPTNHLDLRSREVLEEALNEYEGSMVVISHDRYFINRVVTSIGEIGDGRVELYAGDYDEYQEWKRRRAAEGDLGPAPSGSGNPEPKSLRREARRQEAEERNRRYRDRRAAEEALAPVEARISEAEQAIAELERQQTDEAVYSDPARAAEVGRLKLETERALEQLYAEWESLAASIAAE